MTASGSGFPTPGLFVSMPEDSSAAATAPDRHSGDEPACSTAIQLTVNGEDSILVVDHRTTLLDALRETLELTGAKKGCDQGQCGACTVIVNGRRIVSCLSLAVMHDGDSILTIEGIGDPQALHPMQSAFLRYDGYQCGFCTPGQICSAIAMLDEMRAGVPSGATSEIAAPPRLIAAEIRERMSGNICRCGAYSNIVDAVIDVAGGSA